MTLSLERARSRKPVTWLTLLGLLLLPAAVGGILVAALQNPTERLDSMTAAIVNLDEPVTIDDQYTPLGRQLASGLVEGSDELDSNLTWVISNQEDAAEGLSDGTYQAVITIPEEFSAAATSGPQAVAGNGESAEQATIRVTTPDDGLVADDLITSQIATTAASTLGTMLSETTLSNVLVGFTTLGDQIGEAASGASELATGAGEAATGAAAIPDGATQLAAGADELASGAGQLAGGTSQIASGVGELGGGAAQLGSGASELAAGLDTLSAKTGEAGAGATQLGQGLTAGADQLLAQGIVPAELTAGAAGVASGAAALLEQCTLYALPADFCAGIEQLSVGATGVSGGISQLADQAPAQIATQLRDAGSAASTLGGGLGQLAGGISGAAGGARELSAGAGELAAGAGQLSNGASEVANGVSQLGTGAGQLGDGAGELATGAGELATGIQQLADGTTELADGLSVAATSLPTFSEAESESLAAVIADPVTSNASTSTIFGPTAIPLLAAVVLWFGALASFIALRSVTTKALTSRRSSAGLALRTFAPAAALGAGQGLLVALIVQIVAKYDAGAWWAFAGIAVLAGVAFAAVNQALVAVFGGIGRWISALIGVLALATGLISTVPGWLANLGSLLPTSPAFAGLIEGSGAAVTALIVWAVLALVVTTLVVVLRRTTSAKAVLSAA